MTYLGILMSYFRISESEYLTNYLHFEKESIMNDKHQVHNLIILDESGSMDSIKEHIISGFNEIVQTIKGIQTEYPEQEHFISMITFNGFGQKLLHFADPVSKLEQIDSACYKPAASTPLYDAIGAAIGKMKLLVANQEKYNVLVTILTDGEENASVEFSGRTIRDLIDKLKEENWTFTYIGTDHDVQRVANFISINNVISFGKNAVGLRTMFEGEKAARHNFSKNIRENKDTKNDYFDYANKG